MSIGTIHSMGDPLRIVEVTGALQGRFEVIEESEDGTVLLGPDTSLKAILERSGGRLATQAEFDEHFGDLPYGPD